MKIDSPIRIVMRFAVPFDNPTTLRVSLKTLRVIEMPKAASTFRGRYEKTIRQVECLRRVRRKPASQKRKHSASLAFAFPLRSRYSEFLTLGILRVKNSLSLTVFTFVSTTRGISLGMRPLIPCLHCVPPNRRTGDCKIGVGLDKWGHTRPLYLPTHLVYRITRR